MQVKLYIALISEMHVNTQTKNTLTNHAKYNFLTKILVLFPVDWEKKRFIIYEAAP